VKNSQALDTLKATANTINAKLEELSSVAVRALLRGDFDLFMEVNSVGISVTEAHQAILNSVVGHSMDDPAEEATPTLVAVVDAARAFASSL
jgi:hypothetical protein